ncbi:MAG TPA: DUF2600 family protein [Solirubrobacteraceae bacterium]|nr:DUF2600 family protein [Solirubrobacteraceae bacterium]
MTRREVRRWRALVERIPDPNLRRLALDAQQAKSGNIEGSTAFAAFAPRRRRAAVVRAQVAFQSTYDYLDTLAEQPNVDPSRNARQLHQALVAAADARRPFSDYYSFNPQHDDAGYLRALVRTCRAGVAELPSYQVVAPLIYRLTDRIVAYQSFNLTEDQGGQAMLADWADRETPRGSDLSWWETAASAGSSLGVFALMAAAARPALLADEALAIERAYWPWIGALHSLLDSLVDLEQDTVAGQRSLLDNYRSSGETASRLQSLAEQAFNSIRGLPHAHEHATVVIAMIGFYLDAYAFGSSDGRLVADSLLETLGVVGKPASVVFRARRMLAIAARHKSRL